MSLDRRMFQCGYRECQKTWRTQEQADMCEAYHRFAGERP